MCTEMNSNDIIDIEDLEMTITPSAMTNVPVVKRNNDPPCSIHADSFVPGSKSIYLKTWGCTHNSSDSEYMAGLLNESGYQITDDKSIADLWLLNSCTVKTPAESRFQNAIEEAKRMGKFVVVAGCVPQAAPNSPYLYGYSIIGVQQIDRVVEVVEETLKGGSVQLLGTKRKSGKKLGGAPLSLPKVRKNRLIEIIPINTGCLNHCTYCKTKQARGNLGSYHIPEIVERAIQAFSGGVKELWLTSEDTGTYGRDIGTSLPELLQSIIEVTPEGCMIRLGMTNPPYILDYLDDMAEILNHPRMYSFLHIPVQSGSDYVLGDMKREYVINDFKKVVNFLQERVPGITIATDIICGFPTETDEYFRDTMELVNEFRFPILFINQFFPRPGTPAALMPRVPTKTVKERTRQISSFFQSYRNYDDKVGTVQKVLVTDVAKDSEHFVGHNKFYEQVLVPMNEQFMGKVIDVVITSAGKHSMFGKPLDEGNSNFVVAISRGVSRLLVCTFSMFVNVCTAVYKKLHR